jgi:hypothetical protein
LELLGSVHKNNVANFSREDCKAAIGDRKMGNPRPQWAGFHDLTSAKKHHKGMEVVHLELRRTQRALRRTAALPQPPPDNGHQQVYIYIYHVNFRDFKISVQLYQVAWPASLEDALGGARRELGAHAALAAGVDAFADFFKLGRDDLGRLVVYTHGAFFKSGPRGADSKAAAGVWFGEQSKL